MKPEKDGSETSSDLANKIWESIKVGRYRIVLVGPDSRRYLKYDDLEGYVGQVIDELDGDEDYLTDELYEAIKEARLVERSFADAGLGGDYELIVVCHVDGQLRWSAPMMEMKRYLVMPSHMDGSQG